MVEQETKENESLSVPHGSSRRDFSEIVFKWVILRVQRKVQVLISCSCRSLGPVILEVP
jgi:hypothetical protein